MPCSANRFEPNSQLESACRVQRAIPRQCERDWRSTPSLRVACPSAMLRWDRHRGALASGCRAANRSSAGNASGHFVTRDGEVHRRLPGIEVSKASDDHGSHCCNRCSSRKSQSQIQRRFVGNQFEFADLTTRLLPSCKIPAQQSDRAPVGTQTRSRPRAASPSTRVPSPNAESESRSQRIPSQPSPEPEPRAPTPNPEPRARVPCTDRTIPPCPPPCSRKSGTRTPSARCRTGRRSCSSASISSTRSRARRRSTCCGRAGGRSRFPDRTIATVDHIVPTRDQRRPFLDVMAEDMLAALERNCREPASSCSTSASGAQGIVHVIGPELGLTQPGMTIACGDSHTSTHGAFGAVAFGIGTSQVRDVLASQCLALEPLKVRRIDVTGTAVAGRLREGRDPRDHPPARRERRRRLRLRVRRRRDRRACRWTSG